MADVSEKHIEAAGGICSAISEFGKPAQETIAAALANAEREGMKRAAEIVRATPESSIADRFMVERAILSEAGEA